MIVDTATAPLPPERGAPRGRGRPRTGRAAALPPDERRAATIAAALPLIRQHGRAVTTRQIAQSAGIAEGTIFRVFASKDDLIDAVVEHAMDLTDTIADIRAIDPSTPLDDRLKTCAEILRTRLAAVLDLMIALRGKPGSHRPGRHPGKGHHNPLHGAAIAAITDLIKPDAHALRCSADRAANLLWTMVFASTNRMMPLDSTLTSDETVEVLLHGISTAPTDLPPATAHR